MIEWVKSSIKEEQAIEECYKELSKVTELPSAPQGSESLWEAILANSRQSPFQLKGVKAFTNAYLVFHTEASINHIELALSFDSFFIRQYYKIYKERLEKADNTKWKLLATFRYNKAFRAKEKFYASFCSYKKNRAELNRLSKKLDKLNREEF